MNLYEQLIDFLKFNNKINKRIQLYKNRINLVLFLITFTVICYIFYKLIKTNNSIENFETPTYNLLISNWDNGSGFYSQLLFKLNHYLYCKKYNIGYETNSNNWQYKYKNGWTDYFENVFLDNDNIKQNNTKQKNTNNTKTQTINGCCTILEQFPLRDYVSIISNGEYYKYNATTQNHINKVKNDLGLVDGQYGSIYIRRGDKLVNEIKFIPSSKFVQLLIEKYPDCSVIFVQTDDYNSYLEVKDYIAKNNLNIKVLTLCPETNFGAIAHGGYTDQMVNDKVSTLKEGTEILNDNKEYLKKIKNNLAKPIAEMTPDERYEHTMELITSVDICIKSKICVCDYKSNVSRFIKIAHRNFDAVFDVMGTDSLISQDSLKCPGFDFDSKLNS
jgi:hypothetical protein